MPAAVREVEVIKLLLFVLLFSGPSHYAEGWHGIVPFITQRPEVEKILGAPMESCENSCHYQNHDDQIFIRYAAEPCSNENKWTVSKGTVIEISVNHGNQPKLSALKLDSRKFKRTDDPELNGCYHYENEQQGITYHVSDKGRVTATHWIGTAEQDRKLRCSPRSTPEGRAVLPMRK